MLSDDCLFFFLPVDVVQRIFILLPFRECLTFRSTCKYLSAVFTESSALWGEFLDRDIESTQRHYGIILSETKHYWPKNINVVQYRDSWLDLRTQEILIVVSRSIYGDALRRHVLIAADVFQDEVIAKTMESYHHKEWQRILCVKQTNNASYFLLLLQQCIGEDTALLCKNMHRVYQNHKIDFYLSHITKEGVKHTWQNENDLLILLECTALIAMAEYFGIGCETSRRQFLGSMAFITHVLDRARFLAERYKTEIWEAFNFENVRPRRLLVPPNPELISPSVDKNKKQKRLCD
jgi:hypothetical protein